MTGTNLAVTDRRALLAAVGHRIVRRLAAETNPHAAALFGIAADRQRHWDHGDWEAVCRELDACELTVSQWLEMEDAREAPAPKAGRVINHSPFAPPEVVDAPEIDPDEEHDRLDHACPRDVDGIHHVGCGCGR